MSTSTRLEEIVQEQKELVKEMHHECDEVVLIVKKLIDDYKSKFGNKVESMVILS